MKKLILIIISILSMPTAYASGMAHMKLNIKDTTNNNDYYICVYGAGCYNIKELAGKTFPVTPDNLANDTKIAVMDVRNMKATVQPNTTPCEVNDAAGKTVTLSGVLATKAGQGHINNLRCSLS